MARRSSTLARYLPTPTPGPSPTSLHSGTRQARSGWRKGRRGRRTMIPVTTFAGQKVAVFGLGGSGLVSASALLAGGADVVAFDDDAQSVAKANAAGIPTADLRELDWSKIAALVLAPGVPLTHPSPHWSVALARKAARRGDRRHRAVLPRAPPRRAGCAVRRHHRHQRQIDHHGARSRTSPHRPASTRSLAATSAPRSSRWSRRRRGRVHVVECSSYQIDLAPSLDSSVGILINLSEDHLDRHGTMENYAAVKARLVAGVPKDGIAIIGVDDEWCRAVAAELEKSGKRVVRVSVQRPLADGVYVEEERILRAVGGKASLIAEIGGIGSLRGAAQRPERRLRRRGRAGARPRAGGRSQSGLRSFPGLAHRMEEVGRARRRRCSSTIRRRPTPIRRRRRSPASATFSGSPAASRRPAASSRCASSFRASARPI